ncbi:hypothetical protein D4764_11G0008040 [Takifugu flavidus]|uniref:Uncharacterized protein n=1 Tax=Takifugu flavidus TaxID=433684 RepID=A0A5C6PGL4_9TELE|nr:hypothetical protein D4764_11G0008040 [Takifugu flavidus]
MAKAAAGAKKSRIGRCCRHYPGLPGPCRHSHPLIHILQTTVKDPPQISTKILFAVLTPEFFPGQECPDQAY